MKVAVIGVGGVGSWCAEALLRSGITELVLMDDDVVVESNLNRQCEATSLTLGRLKVEAMQERLLTINPTASIEIRAERFTEADQLDVLQADFIVDAIDSVDCKAELILSATERKIPMVSSMGAAMRKDPTLVRLKRFDKITGDALAKALRNRFKRLGRYPKAKFLCAVSEEPAEKGLGKFSQMPVTAAFGMSLAAAVLVAKAGIEPATHGSSVRCSTN